MFIESLAHCSTEIRTYFVLKSDLIHSPDRRKITPFAQLLSKFASFAVRITFNLFKARIFTL